MAAYARLLSWSLATGHRLTVRQGGGKLGPWIISAHVDHPVRHSVIERGETIDEAAEHVIARLETVGVQFAAPA